MKIFVTVKQVPDTSGKVAVKDDGTLDRASMQTITNPDDLNAVEAALELKDKYDNDKNILDRVTNEDLRKFGMIPEFIGRLPIVCPLQGLDADMLVKILKEPQNAILKQYQKLLALDEVKLEFEDDALYAIAEKALEKDTGARALRSIIEDFMLDIMYEIPKDENIGTVTITRAYVEGKGGPKIVIRSELPEHNKQALLPDKEAENEPKEQTL